jgi:stearoyl-CoA desaturase (delta-9 desaturase)
MTALPDTRPRVTSRAARYSTATLIVGLHLLPLTFIFTGTNRTDWLLFTCIYPVQAIGVGVCLHRYFAHKSFRTSRWFQFVLALSAASTFGNPVRFAGKHRLHHLHTDRAGDPHTPLHGFWSSWFGSLLDSGYTEKQILARVPDLVKYPELMWLFRNWRVPGLALCLLALLIGGLSGMAIGVVLGAAILLHQSSAVNFLCHKVGSRRFATDDRSTNNLLISLLVFGEGWHNNHHRYPVSARAGFFWWEIDLFYWVICGFEALGLVWEVQRPPRQLLVNSRAGAA